MFAHLLRAIHAQLPRLSDEGEDDRVPVRSPASAALKRVSLVIYALALGILVVWVAMQVAAPNGTIGKPTTFYLERGPFTALDFALHKKKTPRAIILFGSGDGGWTALEEAMAKTLQGRGYEVIGIDFNRYADSDYDLATLQADLGQISHEVGGRYSTRPPLILGGYSMGAAQAIAAAGGPHPPAGLIGLLVVDPRSRGRYGLRLSDESNVLPTGPGTFSMEDFSGTMGDGLRVVQWHATEDAIDSRSWLQSLTAPHKEFDFGQTGHRYNNDRADFLTEFGDSVGWIFAPPHETVTATGT